MQKYDFISFYSKNANALCYTIKVDVTKYDRRCDYNFGRTKSNLSVEQFLEQMEAQYKLDYYHSLSIERYRVTDELIKRVKSGAWKPDENAADSKNALAARGYWQAFQGVKKSVSDILLGGDAAEVAERDLSVWYS